MGLKVNHGRNRVPRNILHNLDIEMNALQLKVIHHYDKSLHGFSIESPVKSRHMLPDIDDHFEWYRQNGQNVSQSGSILVVF